MPRLALALCALWFVTLFVFRSIVQLRKTGSIGMNGFHGRMGSLPWLAGCAATAGLVLTPLGPISAILDWPGGALLFASSAAQSLGVASALAGIGGALLAQLSMGESWRVGVDETEHTDLVTTGLFAWVRNPIFSFIGLSMLGLVLLVPNALTLLAMLLTALGIEIQVREVEEPYLEATHGREYREYAAKVGRFFPRLGRLVRRTEDFGLHEES